MYLLDAVEKALRETGSPMHYVDITEEIISKGYWETGGQTPHQTVSASLSVDIRKNGEKSRFQRTDKGIFALREWGIDERQSKPDETDSNDAIETLSFADAAEEILKVTGKPMHYQAIWEAALNQGLLGSQGRTPANTLNAAINQEIKRYEAQGSIPRFISHGQGIYGLTLWKKDGLHAKIEEHNKDAKDKLLERIAQLEPQDFERLVKFLLGEMGFESVGEPKLYKDGGVDVRGTLNINGIIRVKFAVQVKRWKNNVPSDTIQQLRGSTNAHEQGIVITTGDFSRGARKEAEEPTKAPIFLINGEQLVDLLTEHSIGIKPDKYGLLQQKETLFGEDNKEE